MNLSDVIATLPTPAGPAPVSTYRSLDSMIANRRQLAARLRAAGGHDQKLTNRIHALDGQIARADQRKQANRWT